MTTKEYLNRAYVLNQEIIKNKEIISNLKMASTNTSVRTDNERVQTSAPTGSRMSSFVNMIVDLENIVEEQEKQLKQCEAEIDELVSGIEDFRVKLVLKLRYLDFYSWEAIAQMLVCSIRSVYRLHDQGIKSCQSVAVDGS